MRTTEPMSGCACCGINRRQFMAAGCADLRWVGCLDASSSFSQFLRRLEEVAHSCDLLAPRAEATWPRLAQCRFRFSASDEVD